MTEMGCMTDRKKRGELWQLGAGLSGWSGGDPGHGMETGGERMTREERGKSMESVEGYNQQDRIAEIEGPGAGGGEDEEVRSGGTGGDGRGGADGVREEEEG